TSGRSGVTHEGFTKLALALMIVLVFLFGSTGISKAAESGTMVCGSVTADKGTVRGFRVKLQDTVHRITYTVFTRAGRYEVSDLPPSHYAVQVLQEGF